MSKKELWEVELSKLDEALENGWVFRPILRGAFLNIDHDKNTKLDEEKYLIRDLNDLEKLPNIPDRFAIIPSVFEGFVSVDMDFKEEALKKKIWALLGHYKKDDLFLRIGHKEKAGQLWFKTYDKINFSKAKNLDIITTQKRCDALGFYKDTQVYEWPYKKFWEHSFEDLPIISESLVEEIEKTVAEFYGIDITNKSEISSRHDKLRDFVLDQYKAGRKPGHIYVAARETDEFKGILKDRPDKADKELVKMMQWGIEPFISQYFEFGITSNKLEDGRFQYKIPKNPPKVERKSFFDMLYRSIRRNQRIDNKRMAMATTLSICSWLMSLSVRFEDVCPNLMLLLIAPSGSGKSTSTKAIKEIMKIEPKLRLAYFGQDIRTDSAIFTSFEQSPVGLYNIDEASKLFKTISQKGGHGNNIPEILSQLYSDHKVTDPPVVLAKLKNESYGVCVGPKVNMIAYSTESFWKVFSEENYTQGLGRRLFILTSSIVPKEKENFEYSDKFFKENEKMLINMFFKSYIGQDSLFEEQDIRGYEIIRSITQKDGQRKVEKYEKCKKPRIKFNLKLDEETDVYLKGEFVKESNNFRVMASASGSPIQEYVSNSRAEFIKKLAMIYCVCGKEMKYTADNKDDFRLQINDTIDMDAIKWATDMFDYYMIGSTLENIDSVFKKEVEIDRNKSVIRNFVEELKSKEKIEFKKSDQVVRNFFKQIGGAQKRNAILKEMHSMGLIGLEGDLDGYNCLIKLEE